MGVTVQQGYTAGSFTAATQAEQEAASSTTVGTTPGRQQYHPSAAKCWAFVTYSGGTPTLAASHNITSVTDTALGELTITFDTDFSSTSWAPVVSAGGDDTDTQMGAGQAGTILYDSVSAGSIVVVIYEPGIGTDGDRIDPISIGFVGFGDQA